MGTYVHVGVVKRIGSGGRILATLRIFFRYHFLRTSQSDLIHGAKASGLRTDGTHEHREHSCKYDSD